VSVDFWATRPQIIKGEIPGKEGERKDRTAIEMRKIALQEIPKKKEESAIDPKEERKKV